MVQAERSLPLITATYGAPPGRCGNQMHLTDDDISSIARWTPIDDSFTAIVDRAVVSILQRIKKSETYTQGVFETGDLSNYVAFLVCRAEQLVHRPGETYRQLSPVAVYLSLCAPVGVIGRTHASYGTSFCGIEYLDLDDLIEPSAPENDVERFVVDLIDASPFTLLPPDDVRRPLPRGVVPDEYCLASEPWDKYFHVLFANTD